MKVTRIWPHFFTEEHQTFPEENAFKLFITICI